MKNERAPTTYILALVESADNEAAADWNRTQGDQRLRLDEAIDVCKSVGAAGRLYDGNDRQCGTITAAGNWTFGQ